MADNVFWSAIYLGNLAEMDTNEGSAEVETAAPLLTTFGAGAGNALANNITTIETDAGFLDDTLTHDNDFLSNDTMTYNVGAGNVTAELDATLLMNATVTFYDQTTLNTQLAVIQDTTGNTFLIVLDTQPELASQGIDSITFTSVSGSNYSGVGQFNADDHSFVCLTSGALVETPGGRVRADRLRVGDLVTTLDNGPQPILWIAKHRQVFKERPHPGQPVVLRKEAMGKGLPCRDLMLSPNHRVLVRTSPGFALHDPLGALAPVKALTRMKGVAQLKGRRAITYFSFLLPRHEVMVANGIAVESLYPGPEAFGALGGEERAQWLRLAARDGRLTGTPPARLMLSTSEARAAVEAKLLTLPDQPPQPLRFSFLRNRARALPEHLAGSPR